MKNNLFEQLADARSDMFNPNTHTESNNPFLTELALTLLNGTELGDISDDIKIIEKQQENTFNNFYNSLTDKQKDLYDDYYDGRMAIGATYEKERFILGFKFAINLFFEALR